MPKKVLVIGGGASGFFCAINAATKNADLQITIVEKTAHVLGKVKISGGGRCNTTHACFDIDFLSKHYPRGERFVKKAFHWFNATDTIKWFAERGVQLKTEADGRMFPESNSSQTIIDCLLNEVNRLKIEIKTQTSVSGIENQADKWLVHFLNKPSQQFDAVCLATGGFPKLAQFDWLLHLNHTIEPPVPSLFTFNIPQHKITSLMGVSVPEATVKIVGTKLQTSGPILITHWGLSGPAVLKLSAFAAITLAEKEYKFDVVVNWCNNDYNSVKQLLLSEKTYNATQKMANSNQFQMPKRLWHFFLETAECGENQTWATATSAQLNKLTTLLTQQQFTVHGKTTFKEEFVTCGGINLNEVDVNTMQSKIHQNLYFVGELLNIDGVTGGFNFQNAWTTGFIAAKAIAALD